MRQVPPYGCHRRLLRFASDGAWGTPIKIKGDKGDGYTQMGQFRTGMVVPKMGVVSMGGGSYVAKVSTTNPPYGVGQTMPVIGLLTMMADTVLRVR